MIAGTKLLKNLDNLISRRPVTAQIQLCNFCNNFCNYCRYVGVPVDQKRSIAISEFISYVQSLLKLGVKGFILTGGEPTISKDFDKITEWLESNEIPYGINTNFNVLKLIKPRYLKISLDGFDSESYIQDRKIDKYETVISNIVKYLEWKKENNIQTAVGIQKIGMDVESCKRFYEAHCDLNVDYMSFRPVESVNHVFYDTHDEKPVVEFLERLRERDKRVHINYKYYQTRMCFERCYGNFLQIAVNPFGQVIYCCSKSNEIIGNVTEPDILEKIAAFKTDMSTCPVPCRMTGPNAIVKDMETIENDSMFI